MALALIPAPAFALDGQCLWTSLPVATRDRIIAAYAKGGAEAAKDVAPEMTIGRALACGGVADTEAKARQLGLDSGRLAGISINEGAAGEHLAARGFGPATLDRAYAGIGAADRASLRRVGLAILYGEEPDVVEAGRIVRRAAQLAGWRQTPKAVPLMAFVDYFVARAAREAYEAE
jgi:hypothetical protein